jgi:hypothetical protein
MPFYPTDNIPDSTGALVDSTVLSYNNITDHREAKLQFADGAAANTGDLITTVRTHSLSVNDPIKFTYLSASCGITVDTQYYVNTVPSPTTFTIKTSVPGASIVAAPFTDDVTALKFYCNDGTLTGQELVNITQTLEDLVDGANDTIPLSTAVDGLSAFAKLTKEITLLYDKLSPSRTSNLITATTSATGNTISNYDGSNHGLANGTIIKFTNNGNSDMTENSVGYYITSVSDTKFTISTTATGGAHTLVTDATNTTKYYVILSDYEKKYIEELKSIKFNYLQDEALKLAFEIKRLREDIAKIADTGVLPESRYPSGQGMNWTA